MATLRFIDDGVLPPGDHELTISELKVSLLVVGSPARDARRDQCWDAAWRLNLVNNLEHLVGQLVAVGVHQVYIDGSFAEDKSHPNDIDGYFECDLMHLASGNLQRELNALDRHRCWTWDPQSRRAHPGYPKLQLPMWHHYRVELYPHFGQGSGICDRFGNELDFPSAFRISRRTDTPKGIIKLGGLR